MSVIQVSCIDQVMTLTNTPVIASGGVNENYIEFSFCSQWDGFAKVCAFYQQPGAYYHSLLDSTNRCLIPAEVCAEPGPMYFGVVGVKDDITRTSEVIKYKLVEGVMTEITDPSEDIYQQILTELAAVYELVAGIKMPEDIVTTAQLQEHTNDKDNPHGVTAEQLGAALAEHTHTLEALGAASAEHTHTLEALGAASAEHTHTPASIGAAVPSVAESITVSGWDSSTMQTTVTCSGVTASNHVIVTPHPDYYVAWSESQVRAVVQEEGKIIFQCEEIPSVNVIANILIVG